MRRSAPAKIDRTIKRDPITKRVVPLHCLHLTHFRRRYVTFVYPIALPNNCGSVMSPNDRCVVKHCKCNMNIFEKIVEHKEPIKIVYIYMSLHFLLLLLLDEKVPPLFLPWGDPCASEGRGPFTLLPRKGSTGSVISFTIYLPLSTDGVAPEPSGSHILRVPRIMSKYFNVTVDIHTVIGTCE